MKSYVINQLSMLFEPTTKVPLLMEGKGTYARISQFWLPPYQRPYCWKEEQWSLLWSDIWTCYEEQDTHFLGIIVCVPLSAGRREVDLAELPSSGQYSQMLLVDGQQRITTLLLLLRGIQLELQKQIGYMDARQEDATLEETSNETLRMLTSFMYNQKTGVRGFAKYRLSPPKEWATKFDEVFKNEDSAVLKANPFGKAVMYFQQRIRQEFGDYNQTSTAAIAKQVTGMQQLVLTILQRLKIVVLELDEDDAGDVAFESINAKGVPLTPLDLLRNLLYTIEHKTVAHDVGGQEQASSKMSCLLQKYDDQKVKTAFKIYVQMLKGSMKVPRTQLYKACVGHVKEHPEEFTETMQTLLAIVDYYKPAVKEREYTYDAHLSLRVFEALVTARNIELDPLVKQFVIQLTFLAEAYSSLKEERYTFQRLANLQLRTMAAVLNNKVYENFVDDTMRRHQEWIEEARLPIALGILDEDSQIRQRQAHYYLTAVGSLPSDQPSRLITVVGRGQSEVSLASPGFQWNMLVDEGRVTEYQLRYVANYLFVKQTSLVSSESTVEEKIQAARDAANGLLDFQPFTFEGIGAHLDAQQQRLRFKMKTVHLRTCQELKLKAKLVLEQESQ